MFFVFSIWMTPGYITNQVASNQAEVRSLSLYEVAWVECEITQRGESTTPNPPLVQKLFSTFLGELEHSQVANGLQDASARRFQARSNENSHLNIPKPIMTEYRTLQRSRPTLRPLAGAAT